MTPTIQDGPARLLAVAVRVMPAERREWGRAMQAELAAVAERPERWSFAWGSYAPPPSSSTCCAGLSHLLVVLGTLGTLLAWTATIDYPPLAWILYVMVSVLAAVCWGARRAGMLGPTGDGGTAWLLRVGGYLIAGASSRSPSPVRPATLEPPAGVGVLVISTILAGLLIGLATCARSGRRRPGEC